MTAIALNYRHCSRYLPLYISNPKVAELASETRQQLVDSGTDALTLDVLRSIERMNVNGISFDLWVGVDQPVTDEDGNAVLGVCEFDPDASMDSAVLSVTHVCEIASPELVLSTFAHELGHAVFDAPAWIHEAAQGAGLFDDPELTARKAYRTTTPDAEHLSKPKPAPVQNTELEASIRFAEFRANEFMGSLLVPRQHLMRSVENLAEQHKVTITRSPSLDPDFPGMGMTLTAKSTFGFDGMDPLLKALATRFGVTPKFIRVRMDRYGLLKPGVQNH
jgi:hypothetical protein